MNLQRSSSIPSRTQSRLTWLFVAALITLVFVLSVAGCQARESLQSDQATSVAVAATPTQAATSSPTPTIEPTVALDLSSPDSDAIALPVESEESGHAPREQRLEIIGDLDEHAFNVGPPYHHIIVESVAAHGHHVVASELINRRLYVIDVADLERPTILGFEEWPNRYGLSVSEAIVHTGGPLVEVVDISDPAAPHVISSIPGHEAVLELVPNAKEELGVGWGNSLLDSLNGIGVVPFRKNGPLTRSGVRFIDFGDESHPKYRGYAFTNVPVADVDLHGNFAYVAAGQDGLMILDITDPDSPVELQRVQAPGRVISVASDGHRVAVGVANYEHERDPEPDTWVVLMNVSNGQLRDVSRFATQQPVVELAFAGDRLWVGTTSRNGYGHRWPPSELLVVDVSNPSSPNRVAGLQLEGALHDLALLDDVAIVARAQEGMSIVAVTP
ncbi:MAG: hypothetical protein H6648_00735 [Caldilineae bacterium]|nr:hypothetical protein [Caldilineae bacterium]